MNDETLNKVLNTVIDDKYDCVPDTSWTVEVYVAVKGETSLRRHNENRVLYALTLLINPIDGGAPAIYTIAARNGVVAEPTLEGRLRKAYENFMGALPPHRWHVVKDSTDKFCDHGANWATCCGPFDTWVPYPWARSDKLNLSIFGQSTPPKSLTVQWTDAVTNVIRMVPTGGIDRAYGSQTRNMQGSPPPNITPAWASCAATPGCKSWEDIGGEAWYIVHWLSMPGEAWRQSGYVGLPNDLLRIEGGMLVPSEWLNAVLDLFAYPHVQTTFSIDNALQYLASKKGKTVSLTSALPTLAVATPTVSKITPTVAAITPTLQPEKTVKTVTRAPTTGKTFKLGTQMPGAEEVASGTPSGVRYLDPSRRSEALSQLRDYVVVDVFQGDAYYPLRFNVMLKELADLAVDLTTGEYLYRDAPNATDYLVEKADESWAIVFAPLHEEMITATTSGKNIQYQITAATSDQMAEAWDVTFESSRIAYESAGVTFHPPFDGAPYIFTGTGQKWKSEAGTDLKQYLIYGTLGGAIIIGGYMLWRGMR